jgi:hypothetical protein
MPQVLPQLADITIYRWEDHFRASTVLGIVGAGGIGFELIAALRLIAYDQVAAILITILACVMIVVPRGCPSQPPEIGPGATRRRWRRKGNRRETLSWAALADRMCA